MVTKCQYKKEVYTGTLTDKETNRTQKILLAVYDVWVKLWYLTQDNKKLTFRVKKKNFVYMQKLLAKESFN